MPRAIGARRYAQAILQLALERNELDRWLLDLRALNDALANQELHTYLTATKIPLAERLNILSAHLAETGPLARNLAGLLVERGRLELVPAMLEEYEHLYNAQRGIAEVQVRTAIPLDQPEVSRLRERLVALTGKQVLLHTMVDPELMGGVVARVGDKVLDGSLRSKLEAMRRSLVGV